MEAFNIGHERLIDTSSSTHLKNPNKAKSYHSNTFPMTPAIVCMAVGSAGNSGVAGPSVNANGSFGLSCGLGCSVAASLFVDMIHVEEIV
jgi:hypothetical protein